MQGAIEMLKIIKRLENTAVDERKKMRRELNKIKLDFSKTKILNYEGSELIKMGNRRREARDDYYKLLIAERSKLKFINNPTERDLENLKDNQVQIDHLEKTYYTRYY